MLDDEAMTMDIKVPVSHSSFVNNRLFTSRQFRLQKVGSVYRSKSSQFPLGQLKFPQKFPTFEKLLPLYGNFGEFSKNSKIKPNMISFYVKK